MTYTVKPGDTLFEIANNYGISLDDLIAANPQIEDPDMIMPGQVINIPTDMDDEEEMMPGMMDGCMHMPDHEMMMRVCMQHMPYPDVMVEGENVVYARMMMDILAGLKGQLTAHNMYMYYAIMLEDTECAEIADLLHAVAMIEMRHMHDTMNFIKLLGSEPRYVNSRGRPWSASYINYELCNVCDLLNYIIRDAEFNARMYREMAEYINDEYISEWLNRAAMDKEHHTNLFKEYYEMYCQYMED